MAAMTSCCRAGPSNGKSNNVETKFSEIGFNVFGEYKNNPRQAAEACFWAAKLKVLGVFFQTPGNLPHILCEDTTCSFFPSGWA